MGWMLVAMLAALRVALKAASKGSTMVRHGVLEWVGSMDSAKDFRWVFLLVVVMVVMKEGNAMDLKWVVLSVEKMASGQVDG